MTDARQAEVRTAINGILDPCSLGIRTPIGIADLGLVDSISISGSHVDVVLTTTAPDCMFVGHFEEEVERRVRALPWIASVHVSFSYEEIWDDSRMTDAARQMLFERYRRRRAELVDARTVRAAG